MSPKQRVFSIDDQLAFARLSGDYNPIHLDPIAARRLLFGEPVVHGMHALLWALDGLLAEAKSAVRIKQLKARFRTAIPLNVDVALVTRGETTDDVQLELLVDQSKVLTVRVLFEPKSDSDTLIPCEISEQEVCRDPTADELQAARGAVPLCLDPELANRLFPNVARSLPVEQLASLLATTRVVGMEAPGLHSILAGLDLQRSTFASTAADSAQLRYVAQSYDERVSRLELGVAGLGLAGTVTAFMRPAPQEQLPLAALRSLVDPDEFARERALVIGGSRGLGEVAAKLLAAGGASVKLTYHRGAADALRVVSDIASQSGAASCFAYDVLRDAAGLPALVGNWLPTLLCYFATPHISAMGDRSFSASRFREFCDYYVAGFLECFHAVRVLAPSLSGVLYPSSIFVDELPGTMREYAVAKAAGETMCRCLARAHVEIRFHCPRLPRLATDQTASLITTDLPNPAPTLLAALRAMRS
jgi:NAD(P)-dependent dehydrogenase (short-subunit alcohol dehydrogenase family)